MFIYEELKSGSYVSHSYSFFWFTLFGDNALLSFNYAIHFVKMRGIPLSIYQIKKGKEDKKRKNSKGTVVSNGIETTKIEKITNSETDLVFNLV